MKIRNYFLKNRNFYIPFVIIFGILSLCPVFIKREFSLNVLTLSCIWAIMGTGWNLIGGYAGQFSNGHAVFYGIGAYVGAVMLKKWQISPWISVWVGVLISMAVAFVIGKLILRLRGPFFAISTMVIAECVRVIFLNWDFIGGSTGISFFFKKLPSLYTWQYIEKAPFYYICLLFLVVSVLIVQHLVTSKFGYYCRAIRANQDSAESSGVNTALYKSLAYMISAGICSIAGALFAQYCQYLDPSMLVTSSNSMLIVLVTIMGGICTIWGPLLGAFLMIAIQQYSKAAFSTVSGLSLFVYGCMVIIIALFLPNGLMSVFRKDTLVAVRSWFARKKVPAHRDGGNQNERNS